MATTTTLKPKIKRNFIDRAVGNVTVVEMRVTMKDVAEAAGVSAITVSKAFRGCSDISNATKDRIKAYALMVGFSYMPGPNAGVPRPRRNFIESSSPPQLHVVPDPRTASSEQCD